MTTVMEPPGSRLQEIAATNAGRRAKHLATSDHRGPLALRYTLYAGVYLLFMSQVVNMTVSSTGSPSVRSTGSSGSRWF
jgi:hypothetical protein